MEGFRLGLDASQQCDWNPCVLTPRGVLFALSEDSSHHSQGNYTQAEQAHVPSLSHAANSRVHHAVRVRVPRRRREEFRVLGLQRRNRRLQLRARPQLRHGGFQLPDAGVGV